MIQISTESVPTEWSEALEVPYFRMVWDLFPRSFLDGASVLLASYDAEVGEVADEQTVAMASQPMGIEDSARQLR